MYEELLIKSGMSNREVIIYELLLKKGELMASEISYKTGLIRTNVYDILNSLIKKGLVSYIIRSGKKYFHSAEPDKLLDYLDNQKSDLEDIKEKINKILPELKPIKLNLERPIIEVYEGKEGLRTIYEMSIRESLKTKKEILGISVQQQKCRELTGIYHERWYKERTKYKIKSRYLMSSEEKIIPLKHTQFRILPKDAKNPNEIFIFGDVTTQFFFTENLFTAIVIKNKEITEKYRDYFNFLWAVVR